MKSLEQRIRDNQKFLQKEVNKRLESVMNPQLSSFESGVAEKCIFCSTHEVNDLIFDIVAKFYEATCGKMPSRVGHRRVCTHGRWVAASTTDLAYFIDGLFTHGFADIWALCGDVRNMPDFKARDAIATLADFDLMEFVLERDVDYPGRVERYFFYSQYERFVKASRTRQGEVVDEYDRTPTAHDPVDHEEIENIISQQFTWQIENQQFIIPREIEKGIIEKHGKNLQKRFVMDEIEQLVDLWKDHVKVLRMKDLVMSLLKKVGREWIQSLDPERYRSTFSETQRRLDYNKSLMTYPLEPKSRWADEKEELLAWKDKIEEKLGRKIVFNIWQK